MTKPQTPAHGSGKPALSQKAEERKLRADAERGAAGGLPTSVLLMGLAGSAVAASGRLPHEKSGPAAQDAPSQAPQDPALPGAAEAEVSSSQLVSDAAQASMVDGQALQQIVADLVTEAASVAMPGAGQVAAQAGPEGAALTEGSAAEAAAAESAAAQAAQVAVEAVEAAMAAAGAEGIASPPMLLAQAQVPAASAGAASSSAASAATAAGAGASAGAAAGTAAAATATAATAAAAGAAVSTAALLAVGAVVVGAAVASSGSDSSPTPETPADKTAPTLTITDDKTGTVNAAGGNITYTFTFSEAVTGFTAADVTVANGTKGTFTAVSSTVYTLVVTPTAGFEGNVTVDVAASAASDAAGNASTAAAQSVQAVDTKAATVAITDNQSATTTNGAITYTFTFSEAVTGFTADDVTVANGTKGTFTAVSSTVYTLVVTPTAGFEGNVTVDVAASAASDAVGNASAAAAQSVQAVDTKAPTVAITDNQATTTNGAITYTFTFSEAVTGFTAADVTVANGTKGTFTAVSSTVYALVVTPAAGFEGNVTVDVAASAASDAVGNASTAATQSVQAVDTKAPTVELTGQDPAIVVKSNDGTGNPSTVAITYDSALNAAKAPLASAFSIDVNAGGVLTTRTVQTVSIEGKVLTLTLAGPNIPLGATVTVAYSDQAGDGAGIQDLAGNEAAAGTFIKIADGYIRGAQIYIDTNSNGQADPGVDYLAGETDAQGNFFLTSSAPKGTIIAVGGVNVDTGVPNDFPLKAPAGSTSVNPLTTLVQAVLDANVGTDAAGQTPEAIDAATQAVASALGITGAGADLTRYDPVAAAATDPSAQKAAAKIATIFALAEGAGVGSGDTVMTNLTAQVQAAIENGATVALDDAATLGAVLEGTDTSMEVQSKIADAAKAIGQATSLEGISQAQSQFLDTVAPNAPTGLDLVDASDTGTSATDNLTRLTTAVVRVSLDVSSGEGGAAVAGDQVFLLRDGAMLGGGRVLTALDISRGYVDIDAAGLQSGLNTLVARIVDQSGKASDGEETPSLEVTVDTDAPQAAVLGSVGGDDVVNAAEQGSALTGTAEAGARVTLTLVGSTTTQTTVTANSSGAWTYTLQAADIAALGQGDKQLSAVVTDAAGNASAAVTRAFAVDTVAPTAVAAITSVQDDVPPVTGLLTSGATSDDQTIALAGTVGSLGAGEQVAVYDGSTRLGVATVNAGAGTWTFTTPNLANGAHALSARVEDAAGNAGSSGAAINITINTSVPAATAQVTGFSVGAVNGDALQGTLTNDATPRVNGTLQGALAEGQAVIVYDGAARLGTATVASGGASWSFDTGGLSEGAHAFSAVVESASGIQGARSAPSALRIDTVAPSSPTISVVAGNDVINASEQGSSISGTAEAGASVSLSLGSATRTVQAGANGAWSYTLVAADITALGQGVDKTISAVATDAAGNASVAPGTRQIVVDTVAPTVAPTVSALAGDNKINLAERGQTQTLQGPAGSAEAGATVELVIGAATYRVAAAANGSWSYTLSSADYAALGQGADLPIIVRSIDAAGNVGASRTQLIEIDTVAPAMSPFTLDTDSDSGTKGDGRSNVTTPTFRVTAEAGATLAVKVGDGAFVDVADGTGLLQTVDLPAEALTADGLYTITVRATDDAGNTTQRTGTYTLDTTAPDEATISTVAGDNTVNAAEAAAGVTVRGQAGAYVTIELRNQAGDMLGSAPIKANASGAWSYTLSAAELQAMGQGLESLSAVTRDAADNASGEVTRRITIDTQAPTEAPVITAVIDDADGGTFTGALPAASAATNDQTLTLNGTAGGTAAGDRVVVFDGTTRLGEASIVSGSWTFTTPNLSNAAHSLTARVVDAAGNEGPASAAFSVTVNAERPTATAAVTGFQVGETNATALQGSVTNDTTPMVTGTVTGTLAQGEVVVVYDGAARLGPAQLAGSTWSFSVRSSMTPGAHSFSAVVENSAGTQGTRSAVVALSVDTTPPPAPVINTVAGDNVINVLEQGASISGTAEAGATVNLTLGSAVRTVQAGANGAWTYSLTSPDLFAMGQGEVTISASARDAAGNTSATPGTRTITIDTLAPGQPVVNPVAGDGTINAAERAAGVDITGTTDAGTGGRVTVTVAGNSYRVTPGTDGIWTYKLTDSDFNALGQGAGKTVVVAATDAAGNTGAPRTGVTFAIDTVAPTLSPLSLLSASDSGTKGDGISNVTTPQLGFTAEAGATFKVKVGRGDFQDVTAVADGGGLKVSMPAGALAEGANTITLQARDAAGNVVERSTVYTLDTLGAALSISDDESGIANIAGGSVVYTFNFTQPVTGFTADDITVVGGTKGTFSGISATEYRLAVNPNPGFEGTLSVGVAAGAAQDVAGNGSTAAQAPAQAVDTRAPTVTIADNQPATTNGAITYTFTFSEAVTGFTADDVTVANGTPGTFTAVSPTIYTLVVTPAAGIEGNVTVNVAAGAAQDLASNASTAAAQSVQVVDTRAPAFTSGAGASYAENGSGVAYTAAATDASGPVQYALSGGADKNLFNIDPTTGAVSFAASPNFEVRADAGANNVYDLQVRATDAFGQFSVRDVAISVTNVNEAPVASAISPKIVALNVAQTGTISVASAFSDVDAGDALSFTATGLPAGLGLGADGRLTGTATALTPTGSPASVTVTATDLAGLTATQTFALSVVRAPAVSSLTANVLAGKQGTAVVFTMKLSEAVSVAPVQGQPLKLTLSVGSQTLEATYNADSSNPADPTGGVLRFNAQIGAGDTANVLVTALTGATITGLTTQQPLTSPVGVPVTQFAIDNTAPSFQDGATVTKTFAENGAGAVHGALVTDATAIIYTLGGADASKFNVGANGALTFMSAPDFEQPGSAARSNSYVVEVTATDAVGLSSKQTVTVNVTNVNDNAVSLEDANAAPDTVAENAAVGTVVGITASATDADTGASITGYTLSNDAGGRFAINSSTGVVTVKSALDFETSASHLITVKATSSDGSEATSNFTIAVTNVNEAPTVTAFTPQPVTVNVPYQFNAGARFADVDAGDQLTFSATGLPNGLQINSSTGLISGTASAVTSAAVSVTATDKAGLTATVPFTLAVQQGISFTYGSESFIVPTAPLGNEIFRVEWVTPAGANSRLFRLETVSGANDYELWVAVEGNQVVAFKAFSTDAGFMQRSVGSPDGSIYFQVVNATLQRESGALTGITQGTSAPATTLYAVNPANVAAVLTAASGANTLVGLSGVTKVRDFTRAELGITNEQSQGGMVALLDGYINAGYWSVPGATSAYASVVEVPFTNTSTLSFLGRLDAQGNLLGSGPTALNAEMTDVFPVASVGLFIRTGATATSAAAAYHANPATGVLSQISTTLFDTINGSGIPQDVTFISGTDGNDGLGNAAAAGRQWIAGGTGDDLLQGGSANDNLYGGPGSDTLIGAGGSDVLSGMGGDDRLRGGGGADTIYGGNGADRIQYNDPSEMAGDIVTGTNEFWSGPSGPLNAGDSGSLDRVQLRGAGTYNFSTVGAMSYIDRIDVVSGVSGTTQGTVSIVLTSALVGSADQDGNGTFGDIRVVGYGDSTSTTPPATTTAVSVDASALGATQSVWVMGQDGSGVSDVTLAFGGLQGNDTLMGGAGNDYLNGGKGNDNLLGAGGADTIFGGDGEDRIQYRVPSAMAGDVVTGTNTQWNGSSTTLTAGGDATSLDRIQLLAAGSYDFNTAASISYIDRIDVVSNVSGTTPGDFVLILSPQMANSADRNSDGTFGDIRVVGYDGSVASTTTPAATTANVRVDASAFTTQRLVVDGQDGSGVSSPNTPFGGMQGNDTLLGGGAGDYLNGGKGNDVITGGGGNDTIDGSDGQDLARFSGLFSRYSVSVSNGVVTVTDSASAGGDGVDALSNVERFEFSDGRYKVNAGGTGLVADVVEITSSLDNAPNFDVTSAIVLRASEPVTAVAGKMIRLMNDGGAGFNGEAADNDQLINVGSAAVTIQGNLIIIRPPFNLDLANAYHVEIDPGAFVGASGLSNAAVTDPTALNFSTVTPGTAGFQGTGAAVASQAMDTATGNLKASFSWLDIQGTGTSASSAVAVDVGAANVALVFKDYDPAGGGDSSDGVAAPDLNIRVNNFGAGDLLYIDNQNPAVPNRLDSTTVLADTPDPGVTQLSFGGRTDIEEALTALIEIDLAGSAAVFENFEQLAVLLGVNYNPVGEWTPPLVT